MTRCWLCGEPDDTCCACRTLDADMAALLDLPADAVPGRPTDGNERWSRETAAQDEWLSTGAALAGQHGRVLAAARHPSQSLRYPPDRGCTCGRLPMLGAGSVELGGRLHRTDGPCYACDTYGRPLPDLAPDVLRDPPVGSIVFIGGPADGDRAEISMGSDAYQLVWQHGREQHLYALVAVPGGGRWAVHSSLRASRVCAAVTLPDDLQRRRDVDPWPHLHAALAREVRGVARPVGSIFHETERDHARLTTRCTAWTWAVHPPEGAADGPRDAGPDRRTAEIPGIPPALAADLARAIDREAAIAALALEVADPRRAARFVGGTGA